MRGGGASLTSHFPTGTGGDGIEALREKYRQKGVVDQVEGSGGGLNPFLPVLRALEEEIAQLSLVLHAHFDKYVVAIAAGETYAPFGDELDEGPAARYEWWPSQKAKMPLLYICAHSLLAGDVNSTTYNERIQSPMARITDKYRASMKPDTAERLTLSYFMVRKWIKDEARRADLAAMLDAEELAEEQEDTPALDEDGVLALA